MAQGPVCQGGLACPPPPGLADPSLFQGQFLVLGHSAVALGTKSRALAGMAVSPRRIGARVHPWVPWWTLVVVLALGASLCCIASSSIAFLLWLPGSAVEVLPASSGTTLGSTCANKHPHQFGDVLGVSHALEADGTSSTALPGSYAELALRGLEADVLGFCYLRDHGLGCSAHGAH